MVQSSKFKVQSYCASLTGCWIWWPLSWVVLSGLAAIAIFFALPATIKLF
jgi:hypothetical protein